MYLGPLSLRVQGPSCVTCNENNMYGNEFPIVNSLFVLLVSLSVAIL